MRTLEENKQVYEQAKSIGWIRQQLTGVTELALDFETTSLRPEDGRIRITSICNDDVHFIVDHDFACSPEQLFRLFAELQPDIFVYNAKFEQRWLDHYCHTHDIPLITVLDVDFMAKSVIGGGHSSLRRMAARDLKVELSKEEQLSNWGVQILSADQLAYAAYDSVVTWALKEHWDNQMTDDHWNGFYVFNDAVRGTVECEQTGLILDIPLHKQNIDTWERRYDAALRFFQKYAPDVNPLSGKQLETFWRSNFDPQTVAVWPRTEKKNGLQFETSFLFKVCNQLAAPVSWFVVALGKVKYYKKYLSTYGTSLIELQRREGAIRARFNIAQAITGRYSSSNPNKQNIPRNPKIRRAFKTVPGHKLVLADYSGVELRVLGELSGDKQLLHDVIYGNVHAAAAAQINRIPEVEFMEVYENKAHKDWGRYSEMRAKAKPFNFQLTYGAGSGALAMILRCSVEEADAAIALWAERYPKAYNYRFEMEAIMQETGFLPVISGRQIRVFKRDQNLPKASNYPIQGAAADVMYRAMYHVHRLLEERDIAAWMAATVHDELLLTAEEADAARAKEALEEGMILGWLDVFPGTDTANLVDPAIGDTWGDKA